MISKLFLIYPLTPPLRGTLFLVGITHPSCSHVISRGPMRNATTIEPASPTSLPASLTRFLPPPIPITPGGHSPPQDRSEICASAGPRDICCDRGAIQLDGAAASLVLSRPARGVGSGTPKRQASPGEFKARRAVPHEPRKGLYGCSSAPPAHAVTLALALLTRPLACRRAC